VPKRTYQFGWSNEVVLLSGVTVIVKAENGSFCSQKKRRQSVIDYEVITAKIALTALASRVSKSFAIARHISEQSSLGFF
jgi:hypothetical protein